MKILSNEKIVTRDGVVLATDVYLPVDSSGPWPVVLERTPYNKCAPSRSEVSLDGKLLSREEMAQAFTAAGFAVVFQDCRGRYNSTGVFTKYVNEGEDGYDTLEWLVKQNWSNGKIGTMGLSYAAHTQMAAACLNPPGLSCMALDSGGFSSAYQCGIRQGGAFEMKQATWAHRQALNSPEAKANPVLKKALEQEDIIDWFKRMPWKPGHSPLRHVPDYEAYLFEQWSKGAFGEYWKQSGIYSLDHYQDIPDIPIMLMSSWYDVYVKSTLDNFKVLREKNRSATALIMGPWLHGDRNNTFSGDVEFGAKASFDNNISTNWLDHRLNWFKKWLIAEDSPESYLEKVRIFQMGGGSAKRDENERLIHGGQWITGEEWPLTNSAAQRFYFHQNGRLHQDKPSSECAKVQYVNDPCKPVPTIGGALTSGKPVFVGGAFDQREDPRFFGTLGDNISLAARTDVLVFQTDPLTDDLAVSGAVSIHLFIESDAPDTDFTAKLVDVYPASEDYPKGFAMNITDGIFRCRYHDSWEHPTTLQVGKVVEIVVEPFATCNLFKQGHRLRIEVASSNFPKYDVNPNSGEPEGSALLKRKALNTVHVSSKHASYLEIEVAQ